MGLGRPRTKLGRNATARAYPEKSSDWGPRCSARRYRGASSRLSGDGRPAWPPRRSEVRSLPSPYGLGQGHARWWPGMEKKRKILERGRGRRVARPRPRLVVKGGVLFSGGGRLPREILVVTSAGKLRARRASRHELGIPRRRTRRLTGQGRQGRHKLRGRGKLVPQRPFGTSNGKSRSGMRERKEAAQQSSGESTAGAEGAGQVRLEVVLGGPATGRHPPTTERGPLVNGFQRPISKQGNEKTTPNQIGQLVES